MRMLECRAHSLVGNRLLAHRMKETTAITQEARVTIKNISAVAVLKTAQYPFLALTMVVVPRLMGPVQYGEYALLISIITVIASSIDFGASAEMFGRFVPEFEVNQQTNVVRRLASNILGLRMLIGLSTTVVLFGVLSVLYGDQFPAMILVVICMIVIVREVQIVPYSLLYGLNKLGLRSTQLVMRRALSLVFLLVLYHFLGLLGAVVSTLLVDLVLAIAAFSWTAGYFRVTELKPDITFLKPFLRFDVAFYLSWVIVNVWQRSGNLLIEQLTGSTIQVAQFDISNQLYLVTTTLIFVAIESLIPIFTNLLLTGREQKLSDWSTTVLKHTAILSTLIFWVFVYIGPYVIPVLIGPDYAPTIPNTMWLLAGLFPMAITQLGSVFSVAYKKPYRYLATLGISYAVFAMVSVLLIPVFQAMGCAIATLASSVTSATILYLSFKPQFRSSLSKSLPPILLWIIFIPFLLLRDGFVSSMILAALATAVYIAILFALKVLRVDELNTMLSAVRRRPSLT